MKKNTTISTITVLVSILIVILIILATIFLPFFRPKTPIDTVHFNYDASIKLSETEIESAMTRVVDSIDASGFEYWDSLVITYDENRSDKLIKNVLQTPDDPYNKYNQIDSNNIIVLFSHTTAIHPIDFIYGPPSSIRDGSGLPDQWALIRDSETRNWMIYAAGML